MPDHVRVRSKATGHHLSVLRSQYDRNPEAYSLLKQDATYADGTPLPTKHKTSVSAEAEKKSNRGQTAGTEGEN